MPAFRALAGEADPAPLLVRNVVKATGEERWLLNKVTVLRDEAGEPERVVNVIEDVTAVKRAERAPAAAGRGDARRSRARWTRSGRCSTSRRRRCPSWPTGAASTCRARAARCELVAIAHVDPERVALGRELRARYPLRMDESERPHAA